MAELAAAREQAETERQAFHVNEYIEFEGRDPVRVAADRGQSVGAAVTRILAPFLSQQVVRRAADELSKAIARLSAGGSPGLIRIRGPERVLAPLRERIAGLPIEVEYAEDEGVETVVEANATQIVDRASPLGRAAGFVRGLSRADDRAASGNHHRQAPWRARGGAPRRRLEDRLRRFHDRDDGVFPGAVDHQRHRQEHQDAHRALLQSGEGRGAGEGAKRHPRRSGKGRLCAGRGHGRAERRASPIPSAATLQGDKADEGAAAGSSNQNGRRARLPRRLFRRRIPQSPIRPCRSRNCSAILAPASTRSPARRRPGPASIRRRRSRAMAKWGRASTRGCAIRSVRSAATRRSMWRRTILAPRRRPPPPATNRFPCRPRLRRRRVGDGRRRSAGAPPSAGRVRLRGSAGPPMAPPSSRRGIACAVDAISAGARRRRGAPVGRVQPARRLEEAARPARPSRCRARSSTSRRPRREFSSASPTGRISPCSPSAPPSRSRASCT